MDRLRVVASCIFVGMIVMLTLNVDLIKNSVASNARDIASNVLSRRKRATSTKPSRVFGVCGGVLYGRSGWLATPNFPGSSYPALSRCNWTITVFPRMVIKFEFQYMDLEEAPVQKRGSCLADYLELREGKRSTDPLVGGQRYCGKTTKFNPVYSSGSKVYAYFHSDLKEEGEGFAVRWTASDPPADRFNCDFEESNDICTGWKQSTDDEFDWSLNHGRTQSGKTTETGPIKDHTTRSELGFYAFIEASGPKNGHKAILISPSIRASSPLGHCFRFWYHMRGTSMGTLNVYKQEVISGGGNTTAELIFNMTGNLGMPWRGAEINITRSRNKIKFLFEGVRGSSFRGDMAIDDISFKRGPCPAPVVTTTTTTTTTTKKPTTKPKTTTKRPRKTKATTTKKPRPTRPTTTTRAAVTEKCAGMYSCDVVGNCVEFEYFCDGLQDCLMSDDEKNCDDKGSSTAPTTSAPDWEEWTQWTKCSSSCGGGTIERSRKCDNGIVDSYLGCIGSAIEAMECNTHKCLKWTAWQSWTECSVTCGRGVQTRHRTCDGGNAGEIGCIGPTIQVDFCNEHNCPKWGRWGTCEATCRKGNKTRTRTCEGGQIGDKGCDTNSTTEVKKCHRADLPPCAGWSDWGEYGECTATCGGGLATRTRLCIGGDAGTDACKGDVYDTMECGMEECPPEPMWTEWGNWSDCSLSCGGGYTGRRRQCMAGDVESTECPGRKVDSRVCNRMKCPRWRQWNSWQSCSRSCGGGTQERRRSCDGGAPGTGGCDGKDIETQNCNQQSCETTTASTTTRTTTTTTPQTQPQQRRPRWGQYGDWGACSATCGKGMRLRSRQCIGGKVGRRGCRGPKVEKQDCNERQCVEVTTTKATTSPAKPSTPRWGEWEEWEPCSATCGAGTTKRTRTCIGAKRRRRCRGLKVQKNSCAVKACEVTDTDARTSEVKCLDRNVRLARRKGRRCPAVCGGDGECDNGKKCVCDGICGKTCQDTSKSCRNILASIPDGTTISCSSGVSVGSKCTYSCKDGYNLEGEASTFCQGTTKWTNEKNMPMCKGAEADTGTTTGQSCKFKLPVHNSCCGKSSYNSKKARCCDGKTKPAGPKMSKCCGKTPYDPNKKGCCNKKLFAKSNRKCEGGKIVKN